MVSRLEIHLNISGDSIPHFLTTLTLSFPVGGLLLTKITLLTGSNIRAELFKGTKIKSRNVNRVDDLVGDTWPGNWRKCRWERINDANLITNIRGLFNTSSALAQAFSSATNACSSYKNVDMYNFNWNKKIVSKAMLSFPFSLCWGKKFKQATNKYFSGTRLSLIFQLRDESRGRLKKRSLRDNAFLLKNVT